jgi:hypothetical protein
VIPALDHEWKVFHLASIRSFRIDDRRELRENYVAIVPSRGHPRVARGPGVRGVDPEMADVRLSRGSRVAGFLAGRPASYIFHLNRVIRLKSARRREVFDVPPFKNGYTQCGTEVRQVEDFAKGNNPCFPS